MKLRATIGIVIVLAVAGVAYAAMPQKSDDQEVAELKKTVATLNDRVVRLEAVVNDLSTAKPRLIKESPHRPNQH